MRSMHLAKGQGKILLTNLAILGFFLLHFSARENHEFIIYIGVIALFLALILLSNKKVQYPNPILWGLTAWAFLHMAGGGFFFGETRLYEVMLVPLSDTYPIFRYDQFVHIVGFGVATLVMHHLAKPYLKQKKMGWGLAIVIVMAGLGVGAMNEIVEFGATVLVPETGVGGFLNTSLDLVADLIGAILAVLYIRTQR